jgi:hypothetical protein
VVAIVPVVFQRFLKKNYVLDTFEMGLKRVNVLGNGKRYMDMIKARYRSGEIHSVFLKG